MQEFGKHMRIMKYLEEQSAPFVDLLEQHQTVFPSTARIGATHPSYIVTNFWSADFFRPVDRSDKPALPPVDPIWGSNFLVTEEMMQLVKLETYREGNLVFEKGWDSKGRFVECVKVEYWDIERQ